MRISDINENDYTYDGKNVNISKKNFRKVSKDYKNSEKGKERMVVLDPKTQATVSVPVKFTKESSSPWTSSGKHPEIMSKDELEHEIDIFKQQQQVQQHLSPGEIAQLDSLYYYLEQLDDEDGFELVDDPYEFDESSIDEDLANEAVMNDDMIDKLRTAYEPLRGKKIAPEPLMKIFDKIDSNKDFLIQMYREDIPFVSTMAMSRLMLKHGMKADEINRLREAGYEGQSEPTMHYFEIGNEEVNCDKLTNDITSQGVKAFCELDDRKGVVKIHTYSPARIIAMALDKAGVQAKEVDAPKMAYAEDFTRKDFDDNEDENMHAENSLEVLKKFGTPEEYEEVKKIYRRHMRMGSIEFEDQKRRDELVNKYLSKLELKVAPKTMANKLDIEDYMAKKKALQAIQNNPATNSDDELRRELIKKKGELAIKAKELGLAEDYSEMTKKLIQKLIVKGKSDAEIQARTGESGKRIEIIRRNITVQDPDMRIDPDKPAYIVKEGYEKTVMNIINDAGLQGFFNNGTLYIEGGKDDVVDARNVIFTSGEIKELPPIKPDTEYYGLTDFNEGDGRKKGMHPKGHPMRKKQQAAIHANEDVEDETKMIRLNMMQQQVEDLKSNFEILIRLDQRGTGAGDLTDQITTMNKAITALADVLDRSKKIVPETVQEDEYYPGYVLSYRKEKSEKPRFMKKATLADLQDQASELRKAGYTIGKMGRMRKGDMSLPKELTEAPKVVMMTEAEFDEAAGEKDACYRKVKSRYKVWPSAYASGALSKCRKVGAANWGNSKKK